MAHSATDVLHGITIVIYVVMLMGIFDDGDDNCDDNETRKFESNFLPSSMLAA